MAVTNSSAISFSDVYIRTRADLLAQEYNRGVALLNRWNALGGGQAATNVMSADIAAYAAAMVQNHGQFWLSENMWLGFGQTLLAAGAGTIQDTAVSVPDGRPIITADQAITIVTLWRQRMNWLAGATATWLSTSPTSGGGANLNTVIAAATNPSSGNSGTLMNRITELQTQYTANTNAVLSAILAVAVNPN